MIVHTFAAYINHNYYDYLHTTLISLARKACMPV